MDGSLFPLRLLALAFVCVKLASGLRNAANGGERIGDWKKSAFVAKDAARAIPFANLESEFGLNLS